LRIGRQTAGLLHSTCLSRPRPFSLLLSPIPELFENRKVWFEKRYLCFETAFTFAD